MNLNKEGRGGTIIIILCLLRGVLKDQWANNICEVL